MLWQFVLGTVMVSGALIAGIASVMNARNQRRGQEQTVDQSEVTFWRTRAETERERGDKWQAAFYDLRDQYNTLLPLAKHATDTTETVVASIAASKEPPV